MATSAPYFPVQFFTDAGIVANGYSLFTYASGTTTPQATFSDIAGAVPNANPIILDSAGRCLLFLGSSAYTFVLKTPGGSTVRTWDNISGVPSASGTAYVPVAGGVTMTGLFTLSGNATANLNPTPLQQVNSLIAASASSQTASLGSQVPIGSVAMWLTGTPPTKWLELNGSAVSRVTYATLFALWGTTFGVGDGSTTFNLPDCRGRFPRGWDNGAGVDSGRAIGTAQGDLVKTHTHGVVTDRAIATGNVANAAGGLAAIGTNFPYTFTSDTGSGTGAENRPVNFSFMMIAKALA